MAWSVQKLWLFSSLWTSLELFFILSQSTVNNGEVIRWRSVAVGVSDREKVTCDMLNDLFNPKCQQQQKKSQIVQKMPINSYKCPKVQKRIKKRLDFILMVLNHTLNIWLEMEFTSNMVLKMSVCAHQSQNLSNNN